MGSASDARIMRKAAAVLDEFGVAHEDQIVSAHRTPSRLAEYAERAERGGFGAVIAGAGGAAHLPGMVASFASVPVIGVPIMAYNDGGDGEGGRRPFSAFGGLDSLLSITEMPTGSPVAAVGVNKAANAALYAVKILATADERLRLLLGERKRRQHDAVVGASEEMRRTGLAAFG